MRITPGKGVRGLDDPYRSTHIEGFWKISVEYRYRYLEHPYISACISASAAGPTLEIAGILQSPLGENNTGFPLGPQGADDNRRQTGGFHLEDDISVWFGVCQVSGSSPAQETYFSLYSGKRLQLMSQLGGC